MPIQLLNSNFIDNFGNSTPQYVANAGDEIIGEFNIRSQMRMTSINNPLTLDPSMNVVTSSAISWLDEGFRVGDWVRVTRFNSGGGVIGSFYTNISFVDDSECDFGAFPSWFDSTANEFLIIYVLNYSGSTAPPTGIYEPKPHAELDVFINHSLSGQQGTELSLIDGEPSRAKFPSLGSLSVGNTAIGTLIGNRSGQFFVRAQVSRNSNSGSLSSTFCEYTVQLKFVQSGMYNQQWFATNSYLKFYAKFSFTALQNDPLPPTVLTFDENANTGWFDEPYNTGSNQSFLTQGISELDYCVPSVHDVVIESSTTDISKMGIGGCYVSVDDAYYKNKPYSQTNITMLNHTQPISIGTTYNSAPNNDPNYFGALFGITINNVTVNGNTKTINFTFTPSTMFNTFMADRQDGDRLFYLWVFDININHAVFKQQLKCDPPVGGVLGLTTNYGFLDHSQNVTEISGSKTGFIANTEDDVAYYGTFLLDNSVVYDSLSCKIEAFNGTSLDDFTLQETTFSFGGIQINNAGQYLINETAPIVSTLPANSEKVNALFQRVPLMDNAQQYGVSIYYPFLLNWQYWLEQLNASTDFFPTQNRNWEQYDNLPDWEIRFEISLVKNGLAFTNSNVIRDLAYDSSTVIDQTIELFIESTGQNVQVVSIGQQMRVVATHTINNGDQWDPTDTWGMITVEPTESTPRTICSSVLPFDNDLTNPLKPIDGVQMVITYPSPEIAKMECFFDPDIIDLANGCKFTTKIKGCPLSSLTGEKKTTDGTIKKTTDGTIKTTG